MYSDSSSKSEILNKQFQSVFTKKSTTATPGLFGNKYPSIGNLSITLKGVQKLLEKINISKAAGPDLIPGRMLNMLAPELAPIVHAIFTQSLDTGELPRDWSLANVAPIFKKGNRVLAENYRPVSLTCITCKLFEHIVCRHILDHVEDHKILTNLQHGFRSGRSCETQLITTTHDLLSSFNSKSQIDVAIQDFSKAFDTVPHAGLLGKLEHYGIDSKILLWITNCLNNLMDWGSTWGMKFNAKKCNIMRVSRSRKPLQHFYSLGNEILQEVSDAKYLGIQIDNKLDWNKHISTVAARGQSKLAFLNRNLKGCPKKLRDTAYISLIRPALEYSCSVWHPHKKSNKDKIEKVQRRAARFVSNNFRRKASVSEMLHDLGWQSLDGRRQDQRLVLFYKIINGLASVETEDILTPADTRTRKNHSFKFKHLQANCDSYRYSFFPATISSWNNLPFGIEKVDSVEGFKLKLKEHTFRSP